MRWAWWENHKILFKFWKSGLSKTELIVEEKEITDHKEISDKIKTFNKRLLDETSQKPILENKNLIL